MSDSLKLTQRMCVDMREVFENATYDGALYEWDKVKRTLDGGAESKTGTRVDLERLTEGAKLHLLTLMKIVLEKTFHKQQYDALRVRISALNDNLGISAVDRLGEILP